LRVFGRDLALVLSDDDVDTVLRTNADAFTAAHAARAASGIDAKRSLRSARSNRTVS